MTLQRVRADHAEIDTVAVLCRSRRQTLGHRVIFRRRKRLRIDFLKSQLAAAQRGILLQHVADALRVSNDLRIG